MFNNNNNGLRAVCGPPLLKKRSFESVNGTEGYDGSVKPSCRVLAITLLSITANISTRTKSQH